MTISEDTIKKIEEEYAAWEGRAYGSRDATHRKRTGQFFTPPALTVKTMEKYR